MKRTSKCLLTMLTALLVSPIASIAQDDTKAQVNSIKKSYEYIWGEASGEGEEASYEIAHEKFMDKLKAYVRQDPELSAAEGVIMPKIDKCKKKLKFNRTLEITVVCVYVKKSDLIPLYRKNDISEDMAVLTTQPVEEQQQDNSTRVKQPHVSDDVYMAPVVATPQEPAANLQQENRIVNEEKTSEPVHSISFAANVPAKDQSILKELAAQATYKKNKQYLDSRKLNEHDIVFKAMKAFNNINGYWLIYDKQLTLVAILDKSKTTDMLTGRQVSSQEYDASPKVFLDIFE